MTHEKEISLIDSVKEELKSRINNPFIGSFVVSWTLWNWKSVLFLCFSNNHIERKIELLVNDYFGLWLTFILPILSGLLIPIIINCFEVLYKLLSSKINQKLIEVDKIRKVNKLKAEREIEEEKIKLNSVKNGNSLNSLKNDKDMLEEKIKSLQAKYANIFKISLDYNIKMINKITNINYTAQEILSKESIRDAYEHILKSHDSLIKTNEKFKELSNNTDPDPISLHDKPLSYIQKYIDEYKQLMK